MRLATTGTRTGAHDSDLRPLKRAVEKGELEKVKSLIQAGSSDLTQNHPSLFTLLAQISCRKGHLPILKYLVEKFSLDVNSVTTEAVDGSEYMTLGSSLIQIAIENDGSHKHEEGSTLPSTNTFECIEWLTKNRAKLDQKDTKGEDAFATARSVQHLQALGCLAWSLLKDGSEALKNGRYPTLMDSGFTGFDTYEFLEILGLIWFRLAPEYHIECKDYSPLPEIFNTLRPHITQSVCGEKSSSDYRWIGEPICTFPHQGSVSTSIIKIPLFAYIPQGKHKSRWSDARHARTSSGIPETKNDAGLEVISTFDEYCYPDLSEQALKDRNGDQVLCKHLQRLVVKPSDDSPMLAISQACIVRFRNGDKEDSVFVSVTEIPRSDKHELKYRWGVPDHVAIGNAEEFIGVLLSKLIVEYDIFLQDDHIFNVPRLVTVFARSIAHLQQDVDRYIEVLDDINLVKEKSFLHDIEDIREEISMIQNVLIQQETTWREFAYKAWPKSWETGHGDQFKPDWEQDWKQHMQDQEKRYASYVKEIDVENKWRVIQKPQEHFRKLRTQLDKLDRDAERVQRSIELKLDLKQKHASLDEARASLEQARASLKEARTASFMGACVFGFTVITVIFTPLSFVTSLFALPIDRLDAALSPAPDSSSGGSGLYSTEYIGKWMATTEIVSLTFTMLCVCWALKKFTRGDKGEDQPRGTDASETVKAHEGTADSSNTPRTQRKGNSEDTAGEPGYEGSKRGLRDWVISMLKKLARFLENSKEKGQPE